MALKYDEWQKVATHHRTQYIRPKFDDFLKINHKSDELFGLYELSYKIGITMAANPEAKPLQNLYM